MRFGIYDKHDYRFPLYDSEGNRFEGCRGCGGQRDEIEREGRKCIRPMVTLEGTLLELAMIDGEGPLSEKELKGVRSLLSRHDRFDLRPKPPIELDPVLNAERN